MIDISEFGLKIKNYQAGSIYEYDLGLRKKYDTEDAMLTNSLFSEFIRANGLTDYKGKSTRDIICLEFGYGTKDASKYEIELDPSYKKKSAKDIRIEFYTKGVDIHYYDETIHYKMLYRTPGKAKKGSVMFINEKLYDVAHNFLYMGIELPQHNSPIVEVGAYSSLITSTIVGKIRIEPEEILVLKDIDTFLNTDIVKVATDDNQQCYAENVSDYRITSTLFDGQALIDSSIFPDWADGYVLLRQHFTKCAAFSTNIQQFVKDHNITGTVKDMWGREVDVQKIKLITTNNAIKWLKFDISFEYWSKWVRDLDCQFGVVKTAHKSKLGNVQRMSYQMVNSLDLEHMKEVSATSVSYVNALKRDNNVFLDYLERNQTFANDYDVLIALVKHNPEFFRSEYFRHRRATIISNYVLNMKSGKLLQNADNLTIVGSPYAMLIYAFGFNALDDPTFEKEEGTIQCCTNRFEDGEYLAEFRSPFNSRNNLGYLHNVKHPLIDKYFNLGKLCIAVNLIETDFCPRNNGSDQDSDSIYTTDQKDIVAHAKYCYSHYPTIVNEIQPEKNKYDLSLENYAIIDNALTSAQMAIGQSSNLAQICLSYTYNFPDKKYEDYVCILSVLA